MFFVCLSPMAHDKKRGKVAKRKRTKMKTVVDIKDLVVPLSNQFEVLENEKEAEKEPTSNEKKFISPVVITNHDYDIKPLLSATNITYTLKIVSVGRKIFVNNSDDKNKLVKALTENKVPFFSHPDNAKKEFKVVLSGLPEFETSDVEQCLKEQCKLAPISVTMINTKSSNKLFVVVFNKSDIALRDLRKFKVVLTHIVKWLPYKPKRNGPTQCFRCCMYGHGIRQCFRSEICGLCAGAHLTSTCSLNTNSNDENQDVQYKCYNCASAKIPHNHKANDIECPYRAKYLLSRRDNRHKKPIQKENTVNTQSNGRYVIAPQPPPINRSYSQATKNTRVYTNTNEETTTSSSSHNTNGLWSIDEISSLLFDSINELQKCTSKLDQLRVIANLLQHACK